MCTEQQLLSLNSKGSFVSTQKKIKPFLKWAGGKTQLLPELFKYIPCNFNNYIEPFIGAGALYFSLNATSSIISDLNEELINTYKMIQSSVDDVILELKKYRNEEPFFNNIRALNPNSLSNVENAARIIYLNKTCFNGLYRVNKKGLFNVPYGKRKSKFLNVESLKEASFYLKNTTIIHGTYLEVLQKYSKKNDFIFLDPPYYPVGKNADFKRYTKDFFYTEDQIQLKKEFDRLVQIGCHVILTNSAHPFILDLYKDYRIEIVNTKRLISSNPKTRKGQDIIVIGGTNV